jgi:peptide/nickel transport system ATP-binding protein
LLNEILTVSNLKKYFPVKKSLRSSFHPQEGAQYIKAVDDVSFKINKGEVFVIAGESGSGKSTLARLILRAIEPDSGSILFEGQDITKKRGNRLKDFRTKIQMVQQDPYTSIDPRWRVMDIISEPLIVHHLYSSKKEREEQVIRALENVRLEPATDVSSKFPHMLSGGQRQRVALARALVINPKIIVADEPVSMLDISVRAEILQLMKTMKDKLNISYIYITHDLSTSRYIGDNIAIMYAGKIVEIGPINQVLLKPLHPYTQALIDAVSEPDPENLQGEKIIRIKHGACKTDVGCRFCQSCLYSMEICSDEPTLEQKEANHFVSCFLYPKLIQH